MATAKTFAEIAKHFGVSPATVGYWAMQGAPIVKGKANDLGKIAAWRKAWDAKKPGAGLTENDRRLLKLGKLAKARRAIARAKMDELSVKAKEGDVIPLDLAVATAVENVTRAKQHLLTLPFLAPKLHGMKTALEIEEELRTEIEYVLEILSQGFSDDQDENSTETDPAAPPRDR